MVAKIWRLLCAIFDWRTLLRVVFNKSKLDVAFISNMRDMKDRKTFLGGWHPPEGHFNGPRYWLNGKVSGRTRALDVTADELAKVSGRRMAKNQFINAAKWAEKMGVKAILFAAGTKRLFDGEYEILFGLFPKIVFTIGDNGTFFLLKGETFRALDKAGLKPGFCRIGILGPYGFLGELMTKALKEKGFDIIGAGPNLEGLDSVKEKYGIQVCEHFSEMGKVDAVVCCTHSEKIRLTADCVDLIRKDNKKLLVVDVSEPSNMTRREYEKCRDRVVRQDAGNGYAPGLKYVLGAVSYKMFRLSQGVTFGCFAETLALAWALENGYEKEVRGKNWLEVNDENMEFVADLFKKTGFQIPSPRCFARPVKSFNLNMNTTKKAHTSGLKVVTEKLMGLF